MSLITIIVTLVVAGVVLWAINTYIPMAAPIKKIINIVVVLVLVLWLLQAVGIIGSISNHIYKPAHRRRSFGSNQTVQRQHHSGLLGVRPKRHH